MKQYRLCYYDGTFLWFSQTDPKEVWGDDWDDTPYEHNAGSPYSEYGPFKKLTFDGICLCPPCEVYINSPFCVKDINSGDIAWLRTGRWEDKKISIPAGMEYKACIKALEKAGATVFVENKKSKT